MKLLVLIASIALATASVIPEDKVYRSRAALYPRVRLPEHLSFGKIVGGNEAEPHSHPFIVNLILDGMYFCGGSLWKPNVVITAAHCTDGVSSVKVTAGAHNLKKNEASQQIQTSSNIKTHTGFNSIDLNDDVAVIILDQDFELNEFVSTIELATSEPSVGSPIQATGWGKTKDGLFTTTSDVLMDVTVNVGADSDASDTYGPIIDFSTKICIDTVGGMGTCQGDSGGPLFVGDGKSASLVGITSFGSSAGCEAGLPSCFTSVPSFLDWIAENTQ